MAVPSFEARTPGLTAPARGGEAVAIESPGVDVELAKTSRGIWVGGEGNLTVRMMDGGELTFTAVPAGTLLPIQATHVLGATTTATEIVALW